MTDAMFLGLAAGAIVAILHFIGRSKIPAIANLPQRWLALALCFVGGVVAVLYQVAAGTVHLTDVFALGIAMLLAGQALYALVISQLTTPAPTRGPP